MTSEPGLYCREEKFLTDAEKALFNGYLEKRGLSEAIWLTFDALIKIAEPGEDFVYIKCYESGNLLGLALFARIEKYSFGQVLRSGWRKIKILTGLFKLFAVSSYFSFSEILSANLTGTAFILDDNLKKAVKEKIMEFLVRDRKARMIAFIDEKSEEAVCRPLGFESYPYISNSWINSENYQSVHDYLAIHKSTRKHLAHSGKNKIKIQIFEGPVPDSYLRQMEKCIEHSEFNSRSLIPFEKTLRKRLFDAEIFRSPDFVHMIAVVDDTAVGFTTFVRCGSFLGGVAGGYNRDFTKNTFIYDRIMVASLEYALKNGFRGVYFGIINNSTKLRLTDSYSELKINLFIRNFFLRKLFPYFYRFSSIHELCCFEKAGREKFGKR